MKKKKNRKKGIMVGCCVARERELSTENMVRAEACVGLCIYIQLELAEREGGKRRKGTSKGQVNGGKPYALS